MDRTEREAVMEKLNHAVDMKAMMPNIMMAGMHGKGAMGDVEGQGAASSMRAMMLKTMTPNCVGMMLPAIDPDNRVDAAAAIRSAHVEKGRADLSASQSSAFQPRLEGVLAG